MDTKCLIRKGIVFGIILLFVGAGVLSPAVSKEELINEQNEELSHEISYRFLTQWWNTDWQYRKEITIDHTKVDADLTNFPVLIVNTSQDFVDHAQEDGGDFVFTDNANTLQYNHEIEYYDSSTGELIVWINVTYLSSIEDTILHIYYGNPDCDNQENIPGTWDSNYVAVWHMNDETSSSIIDSTGNSNNGIKKAIDQPAETDSKIGRAQDFERSDDQYIQVSDNDSLHAGDEITIEHWFKAETGGINQGILNKHKYGGQSNTFEFSVSPDDRINWEVRETGSKRIFINGTFENESTGGVIKTTSNTIINADAWYYVVGTGTGTNIGDSGDPLGFGYKELNADNNPTKFFDGIIDEVRISKIVRSDEWILTCYKNMNDPESFVTYGLEEESGIPTPWWDYDWGYRKEITMDHTLVAGDLINFPVLISTISTDFIAHVQSDGDDFTFISEDNTIVYSHEIESYDSISGKLIAWVKIPFLSTIEDTKLWMYYGNPTCDSQQNAPDVWDQYYAGVWHMSDESGGIMDSTQNSFDGSESGDPLYSVNGKIGHCISFDGDDYFNIGNHCDAGNDDFTVEMWFTANESGSKDRIGIEKSLDWGHRRPEWYFMAPRDDREYGLLFYLVDIDDDLITCKVGSAHAYQDNNWHYVYGKRVDNTGYSTVDNIDSDSDTNENTGTLENDGDLYIGGSPSYNPDKTEHWKGNFDEVRISIGIARSDEWLSTCYENMNNPESFSFIGDEEIPEEPNQPPTADFSFIPEYPTDTDIVQFTDTSIDFDGTIISWWWDFGDEYYSGLQNPIHVYYSDGNYDVTLIVTDDGGATGTITKTVVVSTYPNNPPDAPEKPQGRKLGKTHKTYSYLTSTTDPDGDIVYYMWDWDDGTTSDWFGPYGSGLIAVASHEWSASGTYHVKVKAKDVHDAESDWSEDITVRIFGHFELDAEGNSTSPP